MFLASLALCYRSNHSGCAVCSFTTAYLSFKLSSAHASFHSSSFTNNEQQRAQSQKWRKCQRTNPFEHGRQHVPGAHRALRVCCSTIASNPQQISFRKLLQDGACCALDIPEEARHSPLAASWVVENAAHGFLWPCLRRIWDGRRRARWDGCSMLLV